MVAADTAQEQAQPETTGPVALAPGLSVFLRTPSSRGVSAAGLRVLLCVVISAPLFATLVSSTAVPPASSLLDRQAFLRVGNLRRLGLAQ